MLILFLLISVMTCHVRNPVATPTQPPQVVQDNRPSDLLSAPRPSRQPFELYSLYFTQGTFREGGTSGSCSPISAAFDFWIMMSYKTWTVDVCQYYDIPNQNCNNEIELQNYYKPPGHPDRLFRLHMAKQIFRSKTKMLRPEVFTTASKFTIFNPIEVDFSKTTETRNVIENWVAGEFSFPIKKFISSDYTLAALEYLMASVVHLESKWSMTFDSSQTGKRPFYLPGVNAPIQVTTMIGKGFLSYGPLNDVDSDFVDLPFEDGKSHMYIILPRDPNNIGKLRDSFNKIKINDLRAGTLGPVKIELPRFIVEKTIDVEKTFQWMESLSVKSTVGVLQKVYVEVTEEGVGFQTASNVSPPGTARLTQEIIGWSKVFQVNHAFAFLIVTEDGRIVLSGLVNQPTWSKRT